MGRASTKQTTPTNTPNKPLSRRSWPALWSACFCSLAPKYWLTTTAPPVASAANSTMMRLLTISTKLTPEMAASPQRETIIVSAMPTVTSSSCSTSSGPVRTSRSRSENSGFRPPNRGAFFSFVASIRFSSFWIWAQKSRFPPTLLPKGRKCTFYHACIHLSTARLPCKESFHRFQ